MIIENPGVGKETASLQWSREAGSTIAFARNVITPATVATLAQLGTVLPEPITAACLLAVPAPVATLACTGTVRRVARRVVLAAATLRAIRAPQIRWTFCK